ncbi:hypothetical protein K474DRAFT_1698561 [Panus rudis PR-1116 ss-1]|nr:hypothetical protein K474DRAFT_1698561 [Panus rudis PR-1116 ss-1]
MVGTGLALACGLLTTLAVLQTGGYSFSVDVHIQEPSGDPRKFCDDEQSTHGILLSIGSPTFYCLRRTHRMASQGSGELAEQAPSREAVGGQRKWETCTPHLTPHVQIAEFTMEKRSGPYAWVQARIPHSEAGRYAAVSSRADNAFDGLVFADLDDTEDGVACPEIRAKSAPVGRANPSNAAATAVSMTRGSSWQGYYSLGKSNLPYFGHISQQSGSL